MSEPFLAEIKMFGFNFAPRGWAFCDGQILPIDQNQSLYSLLGTTYGGDGRTSFALPELRGRTPIHVEGTIHRLGQKSGEETHALTEAEIPPHSHTVKASNVSPPNRENLNGNVWGKTSTLSYSTASPASTMDTSNADPAGGAGHENMQPFLALGFCIALTGTFPSRN